MQKKVSIEIDKDQLEALIDGIATISSDKESGPNGPDFTLHYKIGIDLIELYWKEFGKSTNFQYIYKEFKSDLDRKQLGNCNE